MAKIRLYRDEVNRDSLPPVCMRCGGDAFVYKDRLLSWHPSWVWVLLLVGLLPFLVVALCLTKRMRVYAPFCEMHQHHWRNRALFVYGGLVALLTLGIALIAVAVVLSDARNRDYETLTGCLCVGGSALALVWLIAAVVIENSSIRAAEITKRSIVLTGVSAGFIDAVEDQRDAQEEELLALEQEPRRQRSSSVRSERRRRQPLDEDEDWD